MTDPVRIVPARWPEDAEALRRVRRAVFVVEQSVDEALEWDGRDEGADHLLALDGAGNPVGTARLEPNGKIGRMAVLGLYRARGIGSRLLEGMIAQARRRGLEHVHLHAQEHALAFYHRHGFVSEGPRFVEADIPHLAMSRPTAERYRLPVDDAETLTRVLWMLAQSARRSFLVVSRRANAPAYVDPELARALTLLARHVTDLPLRLFVLDPDPARPLPAPLRDLLHDLPSRAGARCPAAGTRIEGVRPFVLTDDCRLLLFEDEEAGRGVLLWSDAAQGHRARERFETLWAEGETPAFFRRLDL
jgi:predicted GNAT family N-acyltransferase